MCVRERERERDLNTLLVLCNPVLTVSCSDHQWLNQWPSEVCLERHVTRLPAGWKIKSCQIARESFFNQQPSSKLFLGVLEKFLHTGTNTPGQRGPGINGIERVLHIPQRFITRAWLSDGWVSYSEHSVERILPVCRDTAGNIQQPQTTCYLKL